MQRHASTPLGDHDPLAEELRREVLAFEHATVDGDARQDPGVVEYSLGAAWEVRGEAADVRLDLLKVLRLVDQVAAHLLMDEGVDVLALPAAVD